MVNYFVYLFRGNPILPSDLLAWQTGMSVASNYEVSFTKGFLISTLIMYAIFVLGYKLEKRQKKPSMVNRLIVIGTYLLFSVIVFHEFFDTDFIQSKISVLDFFAPKYTYCDYGTVFGFVANVQAMETQEPPGYSVDKVKSILEKTAKEDKDKSDLESSKTQDKPNIIVIMNEAFSDLNLVGDFKTNMDYLPFIRSLKGNTIKGTMYTSVFGGATSDTEYEFLTGNSMAVMPQNCVPYQQFVTDERDSLATTLKAQGYYDIAIHPYEPSGYKRDMVYPLLGFDEFLSMKDFKNPKLIRNFISDESSYAKIIEEYEDKGKDNPLFIFNVTMQNHGGYSANTLFDSKDNVTLSDYSGYPCAEQYLSLLRQSDKAFQKLIEYFDKQKEHTIILLFGDHQPIAYADLYNVIASNASLTEDDIMKHKYQVPFVLWANYNIEQEDIRQISANYLSSFLLKTAGLKGTTYNQYLLDLYSNVPVINALFYIDRKNGFHSFSDNTGYSGLINQYKEVGYNNALDHDERLSKYYYLK
jgi:phosphoglycerol transferase MdoB-like AlkP superfamily enzyme